MTTKPYSKVWTQFETQCMAFTKLRMSLALPNYLVRGYDGVIKIYKADFVPVELLTIYVRASGSKEEVGFFHKTGNEYLLIGGDAAWNIVESLKPLLP